MTVFNALYYPTWNPPVEFFRATLLFFDRFEVIIPEDVPANYDEANARVVDLVPDAFFERRERRYDLDFDSGGWQRFERALDLLVEEAPPSKTISLHIEPSGKQRIEGHVFLHDAKIGHRIKEALEERRLLRPDLDFLAGELPTKGFHVVDERATGLVLSLLADSIARRHLLRTITDEPIGYTLNALNSGQASSQAAVQAQLASSIITTEVPDAIGTMSPQEFVELRKRFEDLRKPFQRAMRDLCSDHMLYDIKDQESLETKIREIAADYGREVEKIRSSRLGSSIANWVPFGVGVLGSTLGIPGWLPLSLAGAGLGIGVQLYEKTRANRVEDAQERSQRLIAGLRSELLSRNVIQKLAAR